MDQQFEEMNNKLNSMTDPTGFLRMVSRNNLLNRWECSTTVGSSSRRCLGCGLLSKLQV